MNIPELLSPAGNFKKLKTALAYGADAVYVGAAGFSMRPDEASFDVETIREAVEYTHNLNKKIYVGINTLLFEDELESLEKWFKETSDIKFDGLIVADHGVFMLAKKLRPDVELHISTQISTANSLSAKFWQELGAKRIVLARECPLSSAKEIAENTDIGVEAFVHGAMCIAVSGRCLLSAHLVGRSGSKGDCKHSCRWDWQLVERERPGEAVPVFETGKETIFFGSKDLCLIDHLKEVISSGIMSLKIEGRMKSEYYVGVVTNTYRKALDLYKKNPENFTLPQELKDALEEVTHWPYCTGFAFGYPEKNPESMQSGTRCHGTYIYMGSVDNLTENKFELEVRNKFELNQELEFLSPHGRGKIIITEAFDTKDKPKEMGHSGMRMKVKYNTLEGTLAEHSLIRLKR